MQASEVGAGFEITATEFIRRARERWRAVTLIVALATAAALGYAFLAVERYEADVLMLVQPSRGHSESLVGLARQFGALGDFAGFMVGAVGKEEAIATLQSRALTEALISEGNLLPVLFHKKWDADAKTWKPRYLQEPPTMWEAVRFFQKDVCRVSENKKTGLISLTIQWKDAKLAAAWANRLVFLSNQALRQKALDRSERNLSYLRSELKATSAVEVQQGIYRLIEQELNQSMVARGTQEYALRILDPAVVPQKRVWPRRKQILLIGLCLGLGVAGSFLVFNPAKSR